HQSVPGDVRNQHSVYLTYVAVIFVLGFRDTHNADWIPFREQDSPNCSVIVPGAVKILAHRSYSATVSQSDCGPRFVASRCWNHDAYFRGKRGALSPGDAATRSIMLPVQQWATHEDASAMVVVVGTSCTRRPASMVRPRHHPSPF